MSASELERYHSKPPAETWRDWFMPEILQIIKQFSNRADFANLETWCCWNPSSLFIHYPKRWLGRTWRARYHRLKLCPAALSFHHMLKVFASKALNTGQMCQRNNCLISLLFLILFESAQTFAPLHMGRVEPRSSHGRVSMLLFQWRHWEIFYLQCLLSNI